MCVLSSCLLPPASLRLTSDSAEALRLLLVRPSAPYVCSCVARCCVARAILFVRLLPDALAYPSARRTPPAHSALSHEFEFEYSNSISSIRLRIVPIKTVAILNNLLMRIFFSEPLPCGSPLVTCDIHKYSPFYGYAVGIRYMFSTINVC